MPEGNGKGYCPELNFRNPTLEHYPLPSASSDGSWKRVPSVRGITMNKAISLSRTEWNSPLKMKLIEKTNKKYPCPKQAGNKK
ncbi:MAG: hypothetical protein C0397_08935 [Odoribacter sp.]|nr:hypothetical protein [Odoribacter sp.]